MFARAKSYYDLEKGAVREPRDELAVFAALLEIALHLGMESWLVARPAPGAVGCGFDVSLRIEPVADENVAALRVSSVLVGAVPEMKDKTGKPAQPTMHVRANRLTPALVVFDACLR